MSSNRVEHIAAKQADDGRMHPLVYKVLFAFAIWSVLAGWAIFNGADFSLALLVGIVLVATVALLPPYSLAHGGDGSFKRWSRRTVVLYDNEVDGRNALFELMIPLIGPPVILTLIAIAKLFDTAHITHP